jgi:cytochrome c
MSKIYKITVLLGLSIAATSVMADAKLDGQMTKLATDAGCLTCHSIESGKKGPNGMLPIGPAWQDVSLRYKGQKGAGDKLLRTVLEGSSPYNNHWKDKVSGVAMPPNAVAIKEADAKQLVAWILNLAK